MQIVRFNNFAELAPYAQAWDRLAASVPFRGWTWLSTWWRHYGGDANKLRPGRELFVLAVFDEGDALIGLAPWFIQSTAAFGYVVRMLGSGEVCSDYLTLLCSRGSEEDIAEIVAEYLTDSLPDACAEPCGWDRLELAGVDCDDHPTTYLAESLRRRGCTIHRRSTINCWRIELPANWEAYLAMLSKKFCQESRRLERKYFFSGKAVLRRIEKLDDLPWGIDLLVELHQRRWQSLGKPGCYASPSFTSFIREVSPLLMQQGQMQFQWLEIDGRPVAVEYQLVGGGLVYAYQSGIEPEAVAHKLGKLTNLACIRRAIEGGNCGYDFLRGDEPYKAHFRARPRPSMEIRIIPDRLAPKLRQKLWLTGSNVKRWLKNGLKTVGK
jgi:CelD/BcsL family acetyltransferase involved in cellulose biosynthesis